MTVTEWTVIASAVGTLAGAEVVTVSLIFILLQMRQNNTHQRQANCIKMANLQREPNVPLPDPDVASELILALYEAEGAPQSGRGVLVMWLINTLAHYEALYRMYCDGNIEADYFESLIWFLTKEVFAAPGGRLFWQHAQTNTGERFRDYVNANIGAEPIGYLRNIGEFVSTGAWPED